MFNYDYQNPDVQKVAPSSFPNELSFNLSPLGNFNINDNNLSLPPSSITLPYTIINISSLILDSPTLQLLEKGFNLSLDPRRIPMEDIICSIESIIYNLPVHEAEEIRNECGRILHSLRPPKPNLIKE